MIALDTNVLVRFLVEDDAAQTRRAVTLVKRALAADEELFVADIVLCELVWVLEVAYRTPKGEIAEELGKLLRAKHMRFEDADILRRTLAAFEAGDGDFADYLIRERSKGAGCSHVATFDKALLREAGFEAP